MKIESFITRDAFANLAGCVTIVEAFTETTKLLFGENIHTYGLWIAFIYSVIISIMRLMISDDYSKESLILSLVNIVVIFLGSVGVYQVGIKSIERLIVTYPAT